MPVDTLERFRPVGLRAGRAWLGFLFGAAFVGLYMMGPAIEGSLDPVLGPQDIYGVTRSEDRLCWMRRSVKYRVADVVNYDVWLDRGNGEGRFDATHRTFPEVFLEADRPEDERPIGSDTAPPPGSPPRMLCIHLIGVKATQPIRLTQIVHFRGWRGLWELTQPLPDIVSP